ncbi:MAG: adenylate/guanylate cyclase domain-containing protein [Saprospiraceae bacterium]|nr:adenylate/guanylate cyclase domain-containing protein [Saprospiraceae bacterium]
MKSAKKVWLRMQLNKVLWITGIWMCISIGQFTYEWSVLTTLDCLPDGYDPTTWFMINLLTSFLAGIIGGSVTVFLFERWFRTRAYWQAILLMLIVYSAVYVFIAIVGYTAMSSTDSAETFQRNEGANSLLAWMFSLDFFKSYVVWFFVVVGTVIGLLVNDKYGPGVLRKFLTGKYFSPKREERIFMFLDLKDSTKIAEQLSPEDYFAFLREVLQDITQPILNAWGEIYQYVGDEIVISWTMERGSNRANCIRCFYDVCEVLQTRQDYYQQRYGVIPEYKAGLHSGHVVAGEIGVVKRDVTYTGDVLNTTSRIQGMCNTLGVNILFSKHLLDVLAEMANQYHPKRLGEIALRGKQEQVLLYTL